MSEPRSAEPFDPIPRLVDELRLPASAIRAVVALLGDGSTVPFIARYRKEATGGLDEVQIRDISERHTYLLELEQRRRAVLAEIDKQGKLDSALRKRLEAATTKAEVEDLYLPYKPKRRTRATIAKERGLEPLADMIGSQPTAGSPEVAAAAFVSLDKDVPDAQAALKGARDILAERIAEDAALRATTREAYMDRGTVSVSKTKEYADKPTKFDTYASYQENVRTIPSHRFLAIRRGEAEGVLRADLGVDTEEIVAHAERRAGRKSTSPFSEQLTLAARDAVARLLLPSVEVDVRVELKLGADRAAIEVFANNLRELLLAAPYGSHRVLGIDPGQRTGCKCVVVDETGKLLANETLYLVQGPDAVERSKVTLRRLCQTHQVKAVAVGNGTHGRETEQFVRAVLSEEGLAETICVSVNEAGASVYSASDVARDEFPDLDLSVRGAISIARRLQDPLAELVKIEPKSIGVGQYQHDVYQPFLAKKLDEVVESCVNGVGVELNTASASLLSRVAGVGPSLAKRIVAHRDRNGPFRGRRDLLRVSGLGPKTFEQAAGFLRIRDGEHPLDRSAVHPERYSLVEKMAMDLGVPVASLVGSPELVKRLDPTRYVGDDVGTFTVTDILEELQKPGRDPRAVFEAPRFRDDVRSLEDVRPGMELEGIVTNVTAFGAFVDVGVHQDGLVHVSQLADRFIKDPREVVKVGDKLTVRVVDVDLARKRIGLSLRSSARPSDGGREDPGLGATRSDQGARGRGRTDHARGRAKPGDPKASARPGKKEADGFRFNPFTKLRGN